MRALTLLLLVALPASAQVRDRRCGHLRNARTGGCDSYAFFEAFPATGAGTSGACSTTAPTGAKGEAMTFARASNATCTATATGGLASSGIADGELYELSTNVARVEYAAGGELGLHVDAAATNVVNRFIEYQNAIWSDVGTPSPTGSQTSPWSGTYATSAVLYDDNDGAAYEGRSQTVTVSAGAAYTAHCYVRAGTLDKARISLDGTAANISGLTSSWSIIEVTDASSSGTSIVLQVLNGNATSDTGSVGWGGCQVEAGSFRTPMIPTTNGTGTRVSEVGARFALAGITTTVSMAATAWTTHAVSTTGPQWLSLEATYGEATPKALGYGNSGFASTFINGAGIFSSSAAWTAGSHRLSMDTGRNARFDATTATTTAVTLSASPTVVVLSGNGAAGSPLNGIISRICVDPDPSRCR